jgi:hypothetical protein
MKVFQAGLVGMTLVALAALPSCNAAGRPTGIDPTAITTMTLLLARTHGEIPYTVPASGRVADDATGIDGVVTVLVDPTRLRSDVIAVTWEVHVDPAAGHVEPASGQIDVRPLSDRLADPRYEGRFQARFIASPGFRGPARLAGTARVVDNESDLEVKAEATVAVDVQDPSAPALQIACHRTPDSGTAPVTVTFDATLVGCVGPCEFRWEFGTGAIANQRHASYTYQSPGEYTAVGILGDGSDKVVTCEKTVAVTAREREPEPQPVTPGPPNHPPAIVDLSLFPLTDPMSRTIKAVVSDPDPGDTVSWDVAVLSGPGPATLTPAAGAGELLSSLFVAATPGAYTLRAQARDDHGAQVQMTFGITVP